MTGSAPDLTLEEAGRRLRVKLKLKSAADYELLSDRVGLIYAEQ